MTHTQGFWLENGQRGPMGLRLGRWPGMREISKARGYEKIIYYIFVLEGPPKLL